jgi:C4-dicarboxylate transporter, DctM subunit
MKALAFRRTSVQLENGLSIAVLAAMFLLPLLEIVGRLLLGRGIPGSIPLVQHLTLWIAFLGAGLAARANKLLALSTAEFLPQRWIHPVRIFTSAIGAGIAACLLAGSIELVRVERVAGDLIALGIPVWGALLVIPALWAVIAGRLIWNASTNWRGRLLAGIGLIVPFMFGLAPSLQGSGMVLPASIVILSATALGLPIFATLGGLALLFFWNDGVPASAVPGETYRLTASAYLPAIPLFTLGGYILAAGGASRRLMRSFTALFGWMPGGLAIVTTLVLAFFTPLTGASGVTILSMGGLLFPVLIKARYPEATSVGLVTVSGSIGLLLPPSLPVILYGIYANVPIDQLFVGGVLPGLLLIFVVAGWSAARGWWAGALRTPFGAREAVAATWEAKWELLLPVVVLVAYFGGYTTLVESSAVTVLYALVIECLIYRDLRIARDLPGIAVECATLVGGFFIVLGVALGLNAYLVDAEIPTRALESIQSHISSPLIFLLVLNIFLVIVGALMDIYSAIFVVVPLIVPMGLAYGIDPVHLGIIFLANMELGYLMPPMGENLFLSSMRFEQPLSRIYVSTLPYVVLISGAVLIITYVPGLTLALWKLLGN